MKLFYFFLSLLFLFISGCASQRPSVSSIFPSSVCQIQKQSDDLHKNGVQVIKVGDEMRLILPNSRFFIKNTPTLQIAAYSVLSEIVGLLNQKKNLSINVVAYTPSWKVFTPNISLAQQQAQAIVDYLLQQGLNTRVIVASAWKGVSNRQKLGSGSFCDDSPCVFSVEIRVGLLQPVDSQ